MEPGRLDGVPFVAPQRRDAAETADAPTGVAPKPGEARRDEVLGQLQALFRDLSGLEMTAHAATPFAELGFDSLFLVQAASALEKNFGVTVAFRDLLGELNSLRALAAHLTPESTLGAEQKVSAEITREDPTAVDSSA